jgi:hypothetical protein
MVPSVLAKAGIGPDAPATRLLKSSRETVSYESRPLPLSNRDRCLQIEAAGKLKLSVCKLKGARPATRQTFNTSRGENHTGSTSRSPRLRDLEKCERVVPRENPVTLTDAKPRSAAAGIQRLPPAARVKKPTLPSKKLLSTDCATKISDRVTCARRARAHLNSSACLSTRAHLFAADRW